MDQIGDLLNRLLRGSQFLLAHPSALQYLKEGEPDKLQTIDPLPVQDALDSLFELRRKQAAEIAEKIPGCPSWELSIQALYDEIRQCALFGLHGAAITLSGVLVEFVVKYAVFCRETRSKVKFDSDAWDEFENITFGVIIDRARKVGLINDHQVGVLRDFKNKIRNPYAHYNIQKLTKGCVWRKVKVKDICTGEVTEKDIDVSENPTMQAIAKQQLDTGSVIKVLEHVVEMVSHFNQEMQKDWRTT